MNGSETMSPKFFWHFNEDRIEPLVVKRHWEEVDELRECLNQLQELWLDWADKLKALSVEEEDSLDKVKQAATHIIEGTDIYD